MKRVKRVKPGERIPVTFSLRERDLVLDHTFAGGEIERRLRAAAPEKSSIMVGFTLDDLDELIGYVAAEANHTENRSITKQLDGLCDRLSRIEEGHTDEEPTASTAEPTPSSRRPPYTPKQGQYLAFIYYYTKINGIPPAEADLRQYFRVTPPVVHQMLVTLGAKGLIERTAGKARSIRLLVSRSELPDLE
ncbi:MAG: LexA family protein [Candidatus Binatia bacterium]